MNPELASQAQPAPQPRNAARHPMRPGGVRFPSSPLNGPFPPREGPFFAFTTPRIPMNPELASQAQPAPQPRNAARHPMRPGGVRFPSSPLNGHPRSVGDALAQSRGFSCRKHPMTRHAERQCAFTRGVSARLAQVARVMRVPSVKPSGFSGRSSAWLERPLWEREVAGSNPVAPTRTNRSTQADMQHDFRSLRGQIAEDDS